MGVPNPLGRYLRWLHTQWPAGHVEKLPEVATPTARTNVPGALRRRRPDRRPAAQVLPRHRRPGGRDDRRRPVARGGARESQTAALDLVIVGAGVSGMAAALEAQQARPRLRDRSRRPSRSRRSSTSPRASRSTPIRRDMTPAGELQFTGRGQGGAGRRAARADRGAASRRGWRAPSGAGERGGAARGARSPSGDAAPRAPRDRGHRPLRQLPQARRPRRGPGQGLQPPARPEGLRAARTCSSSAAATPRSRPRSRWPQCGAASRSRTASASSPAQAGERREARERSTAIPRRRCGRAPDSERVTTAARRLQGGEHAAGLDLRSCSRAR